MLMRTGAAGAEGAHALENTQKARKPLAPLPVLALLLCAPLPHAERGACHSLPELPMSEWVSSRGVAALRCTAVQYRACARPGEEQGRGRKLLVGFACVACPCSPRLSRQPR